MLLQQTQSDSFDREAEDYGTSVVPRSDIRQQVWTDSDGVVCVTRCTGADADLAVVFNIKSTKRAWFQHFNVFSIYVAMPDGCQILGG